ncbi:MAG: hypothetical protein A3H67_01275 [Candidatus Buchananbacteria bacterium RIFCSPLOWO2_02_FULL_46_11b]|uniref:Uncharacterized protein n=1 Tax=Candidatus Buchananbacteria bacterium RIFCSPLOWO2_02_FULL_46_11b TaxID=1797548 RepID=A0A1G1Z2R5_9BACT|nr:MAG: hypothetical protein A3H67_01275 [Candidatus Buchananbacteria bacterium RIFCSPLOWO2_02_FULL_46_11b]
MGINEVKQWWIVCRLLEDGAQEPIKNGLFWALSEQSAILSAVSLNFKELRPLQLAGRLSALAAGRGGLEANAEFFRLKCRIEVSKGGLSYDR